MWLSHSFIAEQRTSFKPVEGLAAKTRNGSSLIELSGATSMVNLLNLNEK
jgi:hypothetical protein